MGSVLSDEQHALLQSTIAQVGVVQDPVVRGIGQDEYELVAGRSRIQELAAQGAQAVQVKVIDVDEKTGLILNIAENVARGSYEYISVAETIRKLRSLGASDAELERVFPWSRRWIGFIEGLQDLPGDIVEAIRAKRLTPTHVQVALNMPTAAEAHAGLQTALNLSWDTATLKVYVQNRQEQLSRVKRQAEETGGVLVIPPANPTELIRYKQCLLCGYRKPSEQVSVQMVCDGCKQLVGYITSQEGPPEKAMDVIYNALCAYYGRMPQVSEHPAAPKEASSQE